MIADEVKLPKDEPNKPTIEELDKEKKIAPSTCTQFMYLHLDDPHAGTAHENCRCVNFITDDAGSVRNTLEEQGVLLPKPPPEDFVRDSVNNLKSYMADLLKPPPNFKETVEEAYKELYNSYQYRGFVEVPSNGDFVEQLNNDVIEVGDAVVLITVDDLAESPVMTVVAVLYHDARPDGSYFMGDFRQVIWFDQEKHIQSAVLPFAVLQRI